MMKRWIVIIVCVLMGAEQLMAQMPIDNNWWLNECNDSVAGINVTGMTRFIRQNELKPIVRQRVAVIDGGFDYSHPWLRHLVTDTLQWNFLGNNQGETFERAGTEAYREFKRLYPMYKDVKDATEVTNQQEYAYYQQMAQEIHIQSFIVMAYNQAYTAHAVHVVDSLMKEHYGQRIDTKLADLYTIDVKDTTGLMQDIETALQYCMRYDKSNSWDSIVNIVMSESALSMKRVESLEQDDDVHRKIGNDPLDFTNFKYGNADVSGDAYHGTMVSGLIAYMMQQAQLHTTLVPIRAIPDGDEYDRDVAAAIRYAVDAGAKVVNMSFGKKHSPQEAEVKKAIQYALDHDVLLVHAAGNFGSDNDVKPLYPRPFMNDSTRWPHMLVVAASAEDGQVAKMSCYGENSTDILAPGMRITSCKVGDSFDTQNGTSLSAPIVSGLALAIRSYFPDLKASQVILCIKSSATDRLIDCQKAFGEAFRQSRYGDGIFRQAEMMNSDSIHKLISNNTLSLDFLPDGRYVHYVRTEKGETNGIHYLYDVRKLKEIKLFNNPTYRYINEVHVTRDGRAFAFRHKGKALQYDFVHKVIEASTDTLLPQQRNYGSRGDYRRNYTIDSLFYVTAIGHDMWLYDTQKGDSIQLTTDGCYLKSFNVGGNATSDNVKPGERGSAIGCWIGKTHRRLCIIEDKRHVNKMALVNSIAQGHPKLTIYPFPMPGDDSVSVFRCYVLDADKREFNSIQLTDTLDDIIDLPRFGTLAQSGNNVYVLQKSRYQDVITLWRINGETGEAKPIIRENTTPHLNEQLFKFHPINEGREILWWSERSGRGRYYLYDGDGELKNAITPDDMVAGTIVHLDTIGRAIIVEGYGREHHDYNPAYKYYYRCQLNGKQTICLTPKPGEHRIEMNKEHTLVIDNCSRIDKPSTYTLYNIKGKELGVLSEADISDLQAAGRNLPQIIKVMAADGKTDIWGVAFTPWWMQPDDRLPIISNPYPGPHTDLVPLDFEWDDNGNQTLADLGFVVVCFGYRGSLPTRGHDFYIHGYQNLRDYALDDDLAAIRQLPQFIPQADTCRVGIYGHSGGGFMTVAAMLQHPDFYKVGVAASGNHDNNIYTKWWGETFHGRGRIPTNIELAKNLNSHLLLIHGDMDNNVHPANTIRMADALIKEGKTFDMLLLPGKDHGLGDKYYMNRIRYYMLQHLAGRTFNHIDIIQHK